MAGVKGMKRPTFPNGYNVDHVVKKKIIKKKRIKEKPIMSIFSKFVKKLAFNVGTFITGKSNQRNRAMEILKNANIKYLSRMKTNKGIEVDNGVYAGQLVDDFLVGRVNDINKKLSNINFKRPRQSSVDLFEKMFTIGIKESSYKGIVVFDKQTAFNNMILTTLQRKGIDIYNPNELHFAMGDTDPERLYELYKYKLDKDPEYNKNFYEELNADPINFINELLEDEEEFEKEMNKLKKASKLPNFR